MKILLVNRVLYPRSTTETVMFRLADALRALGHEVCFFSRDDRRNLRLPGSYVVYPPDLRGLSRRGLARRRTEDPDVARCMTEFVGENRPDAAIVFRVSGSLTWSAVTALRRCGVPVFKAETDFIRFCPAGNRVRDGAVCRECTARGGKACVLHRCIHFKLRPSLDAVLDEERLRRQDLLNVPLAYLAPSEWFRHELRARTAVHRPVYNVGLPLPPDAFDPQEEARENYFVYAGTLSERKCPVEVIDALARLAGRQINERKLPHIGHHHARSPYGEEDGAEVPIVFAGNAADDGGSYRDRLIRRAQELEVDHLVSFPGHLGVQDLRRMIAGCQALIVPSLCDEIAPWILLEAQALGKPVIANGVGVMKERVTEATGWIVEVPNDRPEAYSFTRDVRTLLGVRPAAVKPGPAEDGAADGSARTAPGGVTPRSYSARLCGAMRAVLAMSDEDYAAMCAAAREAAEAYQPIAYAEAVLEVIREVTGLNA